MKSNLIITIFYVMASICFLVYAFIRKPILLMSGDVFMAGGIIAQCVQRNQRAGERVED